MFKVTTSETVQKTQGRDLQIWTSADIIEEATRHGSHYFGKSERRFFGSKPHHEVVTDGKLFYFVESCKPFHGPRFWRVLSWLPQDPGSFERVAHSTEVRGDYNFSYERFDSLKKALRFRKGLVK